MILRYFYDRNLAQASYMVGCAATGEALIIDPARDIKQYLEAAEKEDLRIEHVTETHIHADFVSGSRELADVTDATIHLSDMGDENWKYQYINEPNVVLVRNGDTWMVGNIQIEVMHTPGHTPEHISFMITDTAGADKPIGIFTGDFLFVGDVGRPDLLEAAAGLKGTAKLGAHWQFKSVTRFKDLPDYLQIWPAHGAGSACGKALGAVPSTTLGYEKRFNPAFQFEDEDKFVTWLLKDQPEAPRYFAQMKKVNKLGPALLRNLPKPRQMDRAHLDELLRAEALVVDLRNPEAYTAEYVSGTISIPGNRETFSTYIGWLVEYDYPLYFITPSPDDVSKIMSALRAIGVDNVPGFFTAEVVTGETAALPQITAAELAERMPQNGYTLIDVRGATEYAEKHIAGARHIALGYLPRCWDELPKDSPLVFQCTSGYRALIAASLSQTQGFRNAMQMPDGMDIWAKVLPTAASM